MSANVTLVGNATREIVLRFTGGGLAVGDFGLAVNRKKGEEEVTSFFDVTVFGTLAENCAESIGKGTRVVVTGRLEQQSWEKDGEKRSKVVVIADEVAPSLRWATAVVTKDNGGPGPRPAPGQRKPADYDEEPFVLDVHDDRYGLGTTKWVP